MIISTGAIFYCPDTGRSLFLLRDSKKYNNTYCLPGGKVESDESVIDGLYRELHEEIGADSGFPHILKEIPLEKFTSDDKNFTYHTYLLTVNSEFAPILNHEHKGYAWVPFEKPPKPLHPGLHNTLKDTIIKEKLKEVIENL